jgi:hypothetical protein
MSLAHQAADAHSSCHRISNLAGWPADILFLHQQVKYLRT